ncbi:MAG: hypothetical protein IKR71_04875 [Bacteroidales bacterium]|nr:hypothetical protein [Bacteroidales bacterium]
MNSREKRYSQLSNLQEIKEEKARLKRLIRKQEKQMGEDWDEIYRFWSFVPKLGKTIKNAIQSVPMGLTVFNFLMDLVSPRRRKKE